jgi:hypothetical protein
MHARSSWFTKRRAAVAGAIAAAAALAVVFTTGTFAASPTVTAMPAGVYVPVSPVRILDTRSHIGVATDTPVPAHGTVNVAVPGIPASADGVAFNLTVTDTKATGYIVAYAHGSTKPSPGSNVNFRAGQTVANLAIVPISGGQLSLTNSSAGTVHIIVDLAGYVDPSGVAPQPAYGVAAILIKRGTGNYTVWDNISTPLGGPVGGTASGAFRFTCSTANAPCDLEVQASATVAGWKVYPRVDISKQDFNSGAPLGNCEYGDGTDNNGGTKVLTANAPVAVTLGIGGTLDCGSTQTYPTNGVADHIEVPAGYYDVTSEFTFSTSS